MHDDDQIEEFMGELYDKFYPQVMEGLELMQGGDVHAGIEVLSRPLHTIKGVTGFMGGFESASGFTHKVESFLKKVQAGEVGLDDQVQGAAIASVNMIFQVIEQIRDTGSGPQSDMDAVLERIRELSEAGQVAETATQTGITLSVVEGTIVARVGMPRLHLPEQRQMLLDVLDKQSAGVPLVLDFSDVVSVGSGVWESMEPYAGRFPLVVAGMQPYVRGTFHSWGYGAIFETCSSVDVYMRHECQAGVAS